MKVVNGVQIVTLEVNPQEWNVITAGLNELPRKISEPVVQSLARQVAQQTQAETEATSSTGGRPTRRAGVPHSPVAGATDVKAA